MADSGALTPARIKEIALKRTDRRGEKTLDLDYEFLDVLQDFCSEYFWFWRKLTTVLTTVAGTPTYDLADANGTNAINCEKIINAVYVASSADMRPLDVITDSKQLSLILEGYNLTNGEPVGIMREPGADTTVRIVPTPAGIYRIRLLYWALPSMSQDALSDEVPIVPSRYHHILVKGMEKNLLRYAAGEGVVKYTLAAAEYQAMKDKAGESRNGFTGIAREYTSGENSIRSTNLDNVVNNQQGLYR